MQEISEIVNKKSWKYLVEVNSVSEERLNKVALIGMDRTYTYRQMFKNWEKYAEVFSALNITGENHSRLAVFDCCSIETSFAMYAANMTGASVAGFAATYISEKFPLDRAIREEKITDLFINDVIVNKKLLLNVAKKKYELGIRNIIVVRIPIEHEKMDPKLVSFSKKNYEELREVKGVLFMDDLLKEYEATPIKYASEEQDQDAFIMHTSGTTKGISKPVPLSDKALNAAAENQKLSGKFNDFANGAVILCTMVATSVYGFVNQLHEPLAFGAKVLILPMANSNPFFTEAIGYYKVNALFLTPYYFEIWCKMPKEMVPDFTTVKYVIVGGAYMSAEARKRYKKLAKEHGGEPQFINGYGMSETAGACIIQTEEVNNDSIGIPLPGVEVRIFDESDNTFYKVEDRHSGVLYIHSDSISLGKIDDNVFFETEEIDGLPYICTYDVVHVNDDGTLTCKGRANRYFVNNDGIKFDAGIVETMIQAEPGVEICAVVPWYDKFLTHDTVPVLYVQTVGNVGNAEKTVSEALCNVFIHKDKEKETNLPMQCVITNQIPRNANGKADIFKITQEEIPGQRYIVRPKREGGKLVDITLEHVAETNSGVTNGEVPVELSKDWDLIRESVEDETVVNCAGRMLNEKIMSFMVNPQMVAMQQMQWFAQTMAEIQNTCVKMWNQAVEAFNATMSVQTSQRPQLPYMGQQPNQPQNIQLPYMGQQPNQSQNMQLPYMGQQPNQSQNMQLPYMGQQPNQPQNIQLPYMGQQPNQSQNMQLPYMGQQLDQPQNMQLPYMGQQPSQQSVVMPEFQPMKPYFPFVPGNDKK